MTAPAPRRRATASASREGTWFASSGAPLVVRSPSVSKASFTVMGRPWRGPRGSPAATASSARAAAAVARSTSRVTTAFRSLRRSTRSRRVASSSRLDTSLALMPATISVALRSAQSVTTAKLDLADRHLPAGRLHVGTILDGQGEGVHVPVQVHDRAAGIGQGVTHGGGHAPVALEVVEAPVGVDGQPPEADDHGG